MGQADEPAAVAVAVESVEAVGAAGVAVAAAEPALDAALAEEVAPAATAAPEPPEIFVCPITQELMQDPVVATDGHTSRSHRDHAEIT